MPYNTKEKKKAYNLKRYASRTKEQIEADRLRSREAGRKKRKDPLVREAQRIAAQAYRNRDPLRARVSVHQHGVRRRSPEAAAASTFTDTQLYDWLKEHYKKPCSYCGAEATHIDHKQPLTRGGSHSFDNLDMICEACNRAKRDRTPEEFLSHVKTIVLYSDTH